MGTFRWNQPGVILAAILTLSASTARAGDGTIRRVGEKIANRYIVTLLRGQSADDLGPEFERRHGGKLRFVMKHFGQFSISLPNEAAAEAIASDPRVAEVQEVGVVHAAACCRHLDDYGSQWSLAQLAGHFYPQPVPLSVTELPGPNLAMVQVFVIDTQIDATLAEFQIPTGGSKIIFGADFGGGCPPDNNNPSPELKVGDAIDHGTAVASVLGGNANGVLPEVMSIMSIIALDCTGSGTSDGVAAAAHFAIASHYVGRPAVANISIVGPANDAAFDNAVKAMVDNGIFVAGAAGNNRGDACKVSPGELGGTVRYPGLMITGATNMFDAPANYSNTGSCVDIWAPGGEENANLTYDSSHRGVMTVLGPESGTSFAAPEVAAVAAIYYSAYPSWRPSDTWSQIKYAGYTLYNGLRNLVVPSFGSCNLPHGCAAAN